MVMKAVIQATEYEMNQKNIEEFSRLQTYMMATPKEIDSYSIMKVRYLELKAILESAGINLSGIDRINES